MTTRPAAATAALFAVFLSATPTEARWISPDPLFLEHPELCIKDPVSCNLYAYAKNDPLRYTDPTGLAPFDALQDLTQSDPAAHVRAQSELNMCIAETFWPDETDAVIMSAGLADGPQPGPADALAALGVAGRRTYKVGEKAFAALRKIDTPRLLSSLTDTTKVQLLRSATAPLNKSGLSKIGKHLQKHAQRPQAYFTGATSNNAHNTQLAGEYLQQVLNNPDSKVLFRSHKSFGPVMDVRLPNGAGFRFSEGGDYLHILEAYTPR